MHKNEKFEVIL